MYTTFQNIGTNKIDFNSLVGKYICFLSEDSENLKETVGRYVTNCNYIYKVIKLTNCFMIVEADFHGQISNTKIRKDSFEKYFFEKHYVICDKKPDWNVEVGTYTINVPNYNFTSNPDLTKSFTTEEINNLLVNEFVGQTKTYYDVLECFETLCNIIMKRHFDYVSIGRGFFQQTNDIFVGLNIKTGYKYLSSFGDIQVKSYKNKITSIEFCPFDWISRNIGFENYKWINLEDLIVKYLTDNQEYIDAL